MLTYAGIGARKTPQEYLQLMTAVAHYLATSGACLRSGAADGADSHFEIGCNLAGGRKEIYLPWRGFNGSSSQLLVSDAAFAEAARHSPNWCSIKPAVQKLFARNVHQILGSNLDAPADFVLCWTEGGLGNGGTGFALRIARAHGVPVFDMGAVASLDECTQALRVFLSDILKGVVG